MSIFDFKKRFGRSVNIEEAKKDFVNKINYFLFQKINKRDYYEYPKLFAFICLQLSLNPEDIIQEVNRNNANYQYGSGEPIYPSIRYFTHDDFELTLLLIEVVYSYFSTIAKDYYKKDEYIEMINSSVQIAKSQPISLGVTWRGGKFYPEEAKELSEKLIYESLEWLRDYQKVRLIFKNALDHYSKSLQDSIKRKDVISNSFQAMEELTRIFLNNNKSFDNNFNDLVKKLKLNNHWRQILNRYKELSKEFGRHPGRKDFIPEQSDTEAFLYLSGLIIRLILEKLKKY